MPHMVLALSGVTGRLKSPRQRTAVTDDLPSVRCVGGELYEPMTQAVPFVPVVTRECGSGWRWCGVKVANIAGVAGAFMRIGGPEAADGESGYECPY